MSGILLFIIITIHIVRKVNIPKQEEGAPDDRNCVLRAAPRYTETIFRCPPKVFNKTTSARYAVAVFRTEFKRACEMVGNF